MAATAQELGYTTPHQARSLRACMVCSIVQLQSRFLSHGCPNCEPILNLTNSPDAIAECTSANFNGMIAVSKPEQSWIAKWQRVETYVPGMYAVQVLGQLPGEILGALEDAGIRYVPRDGSELDGGTIEDDY